MPLFKSLKANIIFLRFITVLSSNLRVNALKTETESLTKVLFR